MLLIKKLPVNCIILNRSKYIFELINYELIILLLKILFDLIYFSKYHSII